MWLITVLYILFVFSRVYFSVFSYFNIMWCVFQQHIMRIRWVFITTTKICNLRLQLNLIFEWLNKWWFISDDISDALTNFLRRGSSKRSLRKLWLHFNCLLKSWETRVRNPSNGHTKISLSHSQYESIIFK